ncbi:formimidoylglutamase [Cryomorpha ignava]|uniref:Formimidoylglutamase n=1 Tax=Cryomorpha ignava TaxID=101383 RepID=A0A7K3WUV9_9FLAO|nr:formimidoylglutamase [Cryomorpha ignava]NEN25440.1 formimidoylglutamase [Cryomorpha ignava]
MKKYLKIYTHADLAPYENVRKGAVVWSKNITFFSPDIDLVEQLRSTNSKYILFGITEDAGVLANHGRHGADNAWRATLNALLNVQYNRYNRAEDVVLLGNLDFSELLNELNLKAGYNPADLHQTVCEIDDVVSILVEKIVAAGKIPIAIGGGHNNAYGMLKGSGKALGTAMNAINIDAHADLRPQEYRHSGNGFTYAYDEGFLKRYFIFGLHENYISEAISKKIDEWAEHVEYNTYEQLEVRCERNFYSEAQRALKFVSDNNASFGLEIDCDVMENIPTSALTPSGLSVEQVRRLSYLFSRNEQLKYLHICEAAPDAGKPDEMICVGKLIAYLITDFVR